MVGVSQSVWLLAIGVVILGLAASIYHPVGIAMIYKSVATRGRALGINGIFGSVGTAQVLHLHPWLLPGPVPGAGHLSV